ncbi:MAG TPA: hypothetical protein VFI23_08260 [Rhizomicrobium sp.]|nr:hypothetical protein [Rhizomicrobium sp.]
MKMARRGSNPAPLLFEAAGAHGLAEDKVKASDWFANTVAAGHHAYKQFAAGT